MADIRDMKLAAPQKRLQGSLPKIGIRPIIDGRRRACANRWKQQTMNMAKAAAKLLYREPAPSQWTGG